MLTENDGGAEGNRTPDLSIANAALSQLSYGPMPLGLLTTGQVPDPLLRSPLMGARGLEPLTSTMST